MIIHDMQIIWYDLVRFTLNCVVCEVYCDQTNGKGDMEGKSESVRLVNFKP